MTNNKYITLLYTLLVILIVSCSSSEQEKNNEYNELLVEIENSLKLENYENVIEKADEALEIYDEYSMPNYYKSIVYFRQDNISKSIKEAKKIIEKDGEKSLGSKILAQIYFFKKSEIEKSLNYSLQYNDSFPEDLENNYLLGTIFFTQNKFEDAIKYYSKCIDGNFNKEQSLFYRSESFVGIGNIEKGIEDFIKLRQISDSSDFNSIDFKLAIYYQKKQDYMLSNSEFFKIDSILSNKYIAQNYYLMNKIDSSLIYYNQYIVENPKDIEALSSRYEILKKLNVNEEELFNYYKELKSAEMNAYNFWLRVLYAIIPFCIIFYVLYKVNKYIFNKKYYDNYNLKTAIKYIFLFPIGGAFNYTKNIYITYFNITITSILLVYLINLIIFNGFSDVLIKIIFSESFFKILVLYLIIIFLIDLLTIVFRIKYMNINIRKKLNINDIDNRRISHNQVLVNIYEANERLNNIFK